jgi:hypothetical protein
MLNSARVFVVASFMPFFAGPAMAQTPAPTATGLRPYFIAGLSFERRNLGITGESSWRPSPLFGAGVWLNRFVGLDATIEIGQSQSFDYSTSYSAPIRHRTGMHRDSMILGSIRTRPNCRNAVCVEFVAGGGVGLHHTSSIIRDECGYIGIPAPCVVLNKLDWSTSEAAANLSFGMDVPIGRPFGHVAVTPSFRVSMIDPFAPAHLHGSHEPGLTDGWFGSVGVLISIR